jgi:osmotically-inducible protein OsmY
MKRNPLGSFAVAALLVGASGLAVGEDAATKQIDEQITQQIQEKLATDEPSLTPHIVVSTHDGVVTLAGLGLTPEDVQTAVRDANDTGGVVRVENHLQVG